MRRNPEALTNTTFDLVVIGGGINGAATAREAALRGLKVALVEARDFTGGTSSRSSKLIHGGLRYLEQFRFGLVHESRRERRRLLTLAPHLARPLPFILPIYHGDPYYPLKIRTGLSIYDWLGNLGPEDRHRMLGPEEVLRLLPALRREGLRAAAIYHDSETDDARLTLENVLAAAEQGAVVTNYTELRALAVATRSRANQGEVTRAEAEDRLTGRRYEIAARFWVNAAGPWVDQVRALLPGFDGSKTIRLTKGAHLILPPISSRYALLAAVVPGDRPFAFTPWHGFGLLGTTDTAYDGDPQAPMSDRADAEYLLRAANRVLRVPLKVEDAVGSFAGVRALAMESGRSAAANTRECRLHTHCGTINFISICGGKLTTARALAEKLVDQIANRLGITPSRALSSRTLPLPGGNTGPFEMFVRSATEEAQREFHLPAPVAERIVRTYGSRWPCVLEPLRETKWLGELLPGSPALLAAEVDFAIREEMAVEVEDFLLRRSGLNWLASCTLREAVPAVAEIFARRLGWSAERRSRGLRAGPPSGSCD